MPKTRLDKDLRLCRLIRRYMFEQDVAVPELARRMKISNATLYSRMQNTDSFKMAELKRLREIVHIPADEMREVIL